MKRILLLGAIVCGHTGRILAQESPVTQRERDEDIALSGTAASEAAVVPDRTMLAAALDGEASSATTSPGSAIARGIDLCGGCGHPAWDCCCYRTWRFSLDWLYLQPKGADLGFAVPTDGCSSPTGPFDIRGRTEQLDFDFDSGLRYSVGWAIHPDHSWLTFTGTHFRSATSASAAAGGGLTLRPTILVSVPDCDALTSATAEADGEIDFDRYDLDFTHELCCREDMAVTGLLGVRLAALDQSVKARFDTNSVDAATDLRGAGVRVGLGARKDCWRWHFFGTTNLSVMNTDTDLSYRQVSRTGPVSVPIDYKQDVDRLTPVLDIELGVSYDVTECISLAAGYTYSVWWNVVTVPEMISGLQARDFSGDVQDDLTFDGIFARLEVRW